MDALKEGETTPQIAAPTAADLGSFARREWMSAIVTDYSSHFAWLKNSDWYKDALKKTAAGESSEFIDPDNSEMADWTSGNLESLKSPENADNVKAMVEFLTSEAAHPGLTIDSALVDRGRKLAVDGDWAGALKGTSCASCHETIGQPFPAQPDDSTAGSYPTLAQYGSSAWLKDFIRHPDAVRHYGTKNQMPPYSPQQLSDVDLDLLVRWLIRDYTATAVDDYANQLEAVQAAISSSAATQAP